MSTASNDPPTAPHRIALVGFMGSGKTAVGERLARFLGYSFRDSDAEIERDQGRAVSEIFALQGEGRFRELESHWVNGLADEMRVVIATGGGMFEPEPVRRRLLSSAHCIWLDTPLERIWERCQDVGTRPLFGDLEALRGLHAVRVNNYRLAHRRVDVGDRSADEIAEEIATSIGKAKP